MKLFKALLIVIFIPNSLLFNLEDIKNELSNPYRVLNIAPWSSNKQIKEAYNSLVKKLHPDKNENTKEQFIEVQKAYEKLKANFDLDNSTDSDRFLAQTYSVIIYITIGLTICLSIYFFLWACYKAFSYCWKYIFTSVATLLIIESFVPHFFTSFGASLIFSFSVPFLNKYISKAVSWVFRAFCCRRKKTTDEQKNK
jgi:hypothetical protein